MTHYTRSRTQFSLWTLLLACAALIAGTAAQAQMWEPTGGPGQGGLVRNSFVPNAGNGDYWAAIYGGGMFKSSDGGNTWSPINNGLTSRRVFSMQTNGVAPYRGYAGTIGGGVFKTTDGGANWTQMNNGLACTYVRALNASFSATSPADTLLAGTDCLANSGIYRSVDGGASWTATSGIVSPNVTVNSIRSVAPSGNTAINLRFAATSDGIYVSTDLGVTWTLSNGAGSNVISGPNGPNTYSLAFAYDATNGLTLIAAVEGGGLFKSTDQGANWTNVLAKPPIPGISSDRDGNFYTGIDGEGVYRSADRGTTWTRFVSNAALPPVRSLNRIGSSADSPDFIANTLAGMYRSSDGGATWSKMSVGLSNGYSINVQADFRNSNGDAYAAAADGVYICAAALKGTGGCNWTKVGGGNLGHMAQGGHVNVTPAGIFAITSNLGVFKLDGTNWLAANNGLPNMVRQGGQLRGVPDNPNALWLGLADRGVYYSADAGATWASKNGTTLTGAAMAVRHLQTTPSMVLISTDAGLYKSTDSGATWNKLPFPAVSTTTPGYALPADHIAVDGATGNIYAAVFQTDALGAAYPNSGVWKSTDGGATWTQSLAGRRVHEIKVARNGSSMVLYAGIWEAAPAGGAWQSTDDGLTWSQISSGLSSNLISSFGIVDGVVKAVATYGGGVFAVKSGTTGALNERVWAGNTLDNGKHWYNVQVSIPVAQGSASSVTGFTLSGPGVTTPIQATCDGTRCQADIHLGYIPPVAPAVYTASVARADGSSQTNSYTVQKWSTAFPANISLTPNSMLTGPMPEITWTNAAGTDLTYGGTLWSVGANGQQTQVWGVYDLQGPPIVYNGPALIAGTSYKFYLGSVQQIGGVMHAAQVAIPFCYQQCAATYEVWKSAYTMQDEGQMRYGVTYGANDPQRMLASLSLSGNGQTVNASYWPDGMWRAILDLGTVQPSFANSYAGTVTPKNGVASTVTFQIDKFITAFPSNLQPSAGQNVTTTPVFTWAPPASGNYQYSLAIWPAVSASGAVIWAVNESVPGPVTYNGPSLMPGTLYKYFVSASEFSQATNVAYSAGRTQTFCFQCTAGGGGGGTGGTGILNLVPGWNLVGNSSSGSLDVASAFGDTGKVNTVWKWIAAGAKWAFYAPSLAGQALADYAAGKGYEVLSTVNGGEGFWVNAKAGFTTPLPAGSAVSSASFQMMASGWNLIAIGDDKTPSQFNAAMSITPPSPGVTPVNLTTLWAWDAAKLNWYFYAPSLEANGGLAAYIASKSYLDFATKTLGPTTGFWVNTP